MFQKNSIETCILSRVKQITSPGWMHETSARTWCTGKTQRDRVEREVGMGIGMGNTCKPMAVSFQCMAKFTTKKKKTIVTEWLQPHNSWNNKTLERKTHWDINSDYICITGLHGFLFFSSYLYCPGFLEYIQLRTELCPSNSHVEALTSNTGIWRWVLLEVVGLDEAMRVVDEAMRVVLSWEH